jgi:2-oxoglutarate ferredoxin oxidoreductase subunit beta
MRRNHDITYLVHNNQVYGLTKGQASPTSEMGFITKTTPQGASMPINPISLAIVAGATFVARGYAGDVIHLTELIKQAIRHKGFALIDILQPCVTFNHVNTFKWYGERVYKVDGQHDPSDWNKALMKATEWGDRIPIGVIFKAERPTFDQLQPALQKGPLVNQEIKPDRVTALLTEFY